MKKVEETKYRDYNGNTETGTRLSFASELEPSFGLSIIVKSSFDDRTKFVEEEILLSSESRAAIIYQLQAVGLLDNKDLLGIIIDYCFSPTLLSTGTPTKFSTSKHLGWKFWCEERKRIY